MLRAPWYPCAAPNNSAEPAHRNHRAACPRSELTMQIAAKYKLFRDTSENAESHPRDHFARIGRRKLGQSVEGLLLRRIGRELLAG